MVHRHLAVLAIVFVACTTSVSPVGGSTSATVGGTVVGLGGKPVAALNLVGFPDATLEASLAFCMGCWIYARLQALGLIAADACTDCAPAP